MTKRRHQPERQMSAEAQRALISSDYTSTPADQINDQHDHGYDKQEMNEAAGDVKTESQ